MGPKLATGMIDGVVECLQGLCETAQASVGCQNKVDGRRRRECPFEVEVDHHDPYERKVAFVLHRLGLACSGTRRTRRSQITSGSEVMCGRYALALSNEEVYDALQNQLPRVFQGERRWEREQDHRPK